MFVAGESLMEPVREGWRGHSFGFVLVVGWQS